MTEPRPSTSARSRAAISWISGPVLRARTEDSFSVNEAVTVGPRRLQGEVIHLDGAEIVAQVYENTSGLRPGDRVEGTGAPMSIQVRPGILGRIFDGLLRPLEGSDELVMTGTPPLSPQTLAFEPAVRVGDPVAPGTTFGWARHETGRRLACLVPPDLAGVIEHVVAAGPRAEDEILCVVAQAGGARRELSMVQTWPVRRPRPVAARLPADRPMLTGQRILDTLFPIAQGSKAALPGGFGTGKTILQQALAKFSEVDIVVYVGCGERGNEMTEVLEEFPQLEDPRTGGSLLERTVIIANTSNMPVAAREASIYTGATVAEYFRDQGLHVALMADSTSRWAEALREISGRLGELPAESGFPAYLSTRLAEFYERAGRVRTLGGDEGSLTIIGAVSPPGGDFSEPVTKHTQRYVRCVWSLDPQRAHARAYPAIHPLLSYSEDVPAVAPWWHAQVNPQWEQQRLELLRLLGEQARIERMARIVGRDALPEAQRLVLLCTELFDTAYLRQSALSLTDGRCSPARQAAMLRILTRFVRLATDAQAQGMSPEDIARLPILARLFRMAEEVSEDDLDEFDRLGRELEHAFADPGEAHAS